MNAKASGRGAGRPKVGSDASSTRLGSRKAKARKGQIDFSDCKPQLLQEVITRIVDEGALVSFSRTSDGGALVVYVKDGRDENKEYPTDADALEELLTDLHRLYESA